MVLGKAVFALVMIFWALAEGRHAHETVPIDRARSGCRDGC